MKVGGEERQKHITENPEVNSSGDGCEKIELDCIKGVTMESRFLYPQRTCIPSVG